MKKNTKIFQGFYTNYHHGSAIDLGEITNKKRWDNKIYVIFYFNYLMILETGKDYRLGKIS